MRVLLVDDNSLMMEGLQDLLELHAIEVCGKATEGMQAVELARKLIPDVILMDIRMPRCDGLSATRLIKAEMPDMKIVILTTSTDDQDLFEAVKAGACGYLLKSIEPEELLEALDQAARGVPPFSRGLAAKLLAEFARLSDQSTLASQDARQRNGRSPASTLSPREMEVLNLVSQGLTYKAVGARLGLSTSTVKYHMAEIVSRLHLENRAQVLAYAGQLRLGRDSSSG